MLPERRRPSAPAFVFGDYIRSTEAHFRQLRARKQNWERIFGYIS